MDVHRARFVPYPSSAINALAFSHTSGDGLRTSDQKSDLRLAVGRANGNIEIWNPAKGAWVQEVAFRSGRDRSVEGLAWVQEPDDTDQSGKAVSGALRLFSIGYSSTVTEWDLGTGLPKRQSSGTFSEVWCIAAQPRYQKQQKEKDEFAERSGEWRGQNLVAGCADGTLAILSTADDDLKFQKYLTAPTNKKARCLSVAFQNRHTVVAGFADSTIRIFDNRSSTLLRNITLGAGPAGGPRDILIWVVRCLPNGDVVSGDSMGEVRFFDGKTLSQYQRIAGHEADVLDIAISSDGRSVWSTGMDRRTVHYANDALGSSRRRWERRSHRIHHGHDVKAMATFENKKLSMIASGGLDTNLVILPMRGYGNEHHRTIPGLPQTQALTSLPSGRLLLSWWGSELSVWRILRKEDQGKPHRLLTKIVLKREESIASASIKELISGGYLLAASTAANVKLFKLSEGPSESLIVRKLEHALQPSAARMVLISPDSRWLAMVTHRNQIHLARICLSVQGELDFVPTTVLLKRLSKHTRLRDRWSGALGTYRQTITRLQFSPDSRILVVSDLDGHVDGWILTGHEDSEAPKVDLPDSDSSSSSSDSDSSDAEEREHKNAPIMFYNQFWTQIPSINLLPRLDSAPLILDFRPSIPQLSDVVRHRQKPASEPNGNPGVHATRGNPRPVPHFAPGGPYFLVIMTAQHQLYEFDLLSGRLSDWSKRNPSSKLPDQFQKLRDRAVGCLWHANSSWQRLWLYGVSWVWMFDMSQDLEDSASTAVEESSAVNGSLLPKRKRKRHGAGAGGPMERTEIKGLHADQNERSGTASGRKQQAHDTRQENGVDDGYSTSDDEPLLDSTTNGDDAADDGMAQEGKSTAIRSSHPRSWYSFKYRPVLGIAPISDEVGEVRIKKTKKRRRIAGRKQDVHVEQEVAVERDAVEVVVVERPVWDLDLPQRLEGRHDR